MLPEGGIVRHFLYLIDIVLVGRLRQIKHGPFGCAVCAFLVDNLHIDL